MPRELRICVMGNIGTSWSTLCGLMDTMPHCHSGASLVEDREDERAGRAGEEEEAGWADIAVRGGQERRGRGGSEWAGDAG